MKEGFYFYRKKVYYGRYDETQMCGYASLSIIKPELIQSEHPICEDDRAVRLWDNHRLIFKSIVRRSAYSGSSSL